MSPHNDHVLSGVLLLPFNVVPFSDPTASNGEETSAVFSRKRLQTVTLLPRRVSVTLPRPLICSSQKKKSAVSRRSSRIWQFPPENQNWANGNNRCDRRCETCDVQRWLWCFREALLCHEAALISSAGVPRSVCFSSHTCSPAFHPAGSLFFFLLFSNLFWSTLPLRFLAQCRLGWERHVPIVLYSRREYQKPAVSFCYWTVLNHSWQLDTSPAKKYGGISPLWCHKPSVVSVFVSPFWGCCLCLL